MNTQTTVDAELRQAITATIDRLRDSGAIYALDDHERDRIADELLPVFEAERSATLTRMAELLEALGMDDASAQLRYQATPYTDDTAAVSGVR